MLGRKSVEAAVSCVRKKKCGGGSKLCQNKSVEAAVSCVRKKKCGGGSKLC